MNEKKFYQKSWFIIIMLITVFPVGIFLMWKYTDWNKYVKIAISVFWVLVLVIPNGDTVPPTLNVKDQIVFQIDDEITEQIIADSSVEEITDNISNTDGLEVYLKGYTQISNQETSENVVTICAKDEVDNETCDDVNVIVDDAEKKAAEAEAKAKAEAEAKAKAEAEAKAKAEAEAKAKAEAEAKAKAEAEAKAAEEVKAAEEAKAVDTTNGATALCRDGTYSYAANHQGACSHHDGVAEWYK